MGTAATRSPGRPARGNAEETRADLVCAACELFGRYGYHGTTLAQVAHRAGITRPALHYHFRSKRALYQQVIEVCYRTVLVPALDAAVKESTLVQQVWVFLDVAGRADFADAQCAAPFLCTSSVECATSPELCDPDHDPITTVRAFLTSAVDAAKQRGEIGSDIEGGPLVESLVALLCGVWVYVGFLGTEHERAITPAIHRLLTGKLYSQP